MEVVKYSNGVSTVNGIPFVDDIGDFIGKVTRDATGLALDVVRDIKDTVGGKSAPPQLVPRPGSGDPGSGEEDGGVNPWLIGGLALGAGVIALIVLKD